MLLVHIGSPEDENVPLGQADKVAILEVEVHLLPVCKHLEG